MKLGYLIVLLLSALLFIGGPDANSHRIFKEFWDTGHMALFAGLAIILLSLPLFNKKPWWFWFVLITLFSLVLGMSVEVIQSVIGRSFDMDDLLNDLLGGYLGLLIFTALQSQRSIAIRVAMYPLMLLVIVIVLRPLAFVIIDEFVMEDEFPVLADFETPYELSRWDKNLASFSIDDRQTRYGKKAMRIEFSTGKYPGISLNAFLRDWQDYVAVKFSIYNTTDIDLIMELKIYDWQHINNGYEYSDRFNRELTLRPGWNDFSIAMEEIQAAPKQRSMMLGDIASFSLFLHELDKPMTMYFDGLRLSSSK